VQVGYHLTPFWSPTDRHPAAILDEAIEVVRATAHLDFEWVSMGQHWLSYPTIWPAPIPFLARLAPETGSMRIKTSVLLLPLLNPVEVAENVATLDHLTHGRLTVGVSIGYRETELAAAGVTRRDRASKLEETREEIGLDGVGFTIYSLPPSPAERIEYLQMIAEEIVAPATARTPATPEVGRL